MQVTALSESNFPNKGMAARHPSGGHVEHVDVQAVSLPWQSL